MLTTRSAGGLRAWPLEGRPDRDAGIIWFVTDLRSGKEQEIESEHDVGLVFVNAKANAYLSITARAEVTRDDAKAAEIWKTTDKMWWKGRTIRTCACCACVRSPRNYGMGRRARPWPRSSSSRRNSGEAEPRRESQNDRRYALIVASA